MYLVGAHSDNSIATQCINDRIIYKQYFVKFFVFSSQRNIFQSICLSFKSKVLCKFLIWHFFSFDIFFVKKIFPQTDKKKLCCLYNIVFFPKSKDF